MWYRPTSGGPKRALPTMFFGSQRLSRRRTAAMFVTIMLLLGPASQRKCPRVSRGSRDPGPLSVRWRARPSNLVLEHGILVGHEHRQKYGCARPSSRTRIAATRRAIRILGARPLYCTCAIRVLVRGPSLKRTSSPRRASYDSKRGRAIALAQFAPGIPLCEQWPVARPGCLMGG